VNEHSRAHTLQLHLDELQLELQRTAAERDLAYRETEHVRQQLQESQVETDKYRVCIITITHALLMGHRIY